MNKKYLLKSIKSLGKYKKKEYKSLFTSIHIFTKTLLFFEEGLLFEQKCYLNWLFSKTEKVLGLSRDNSNQMALYYLEEIYANLEIEEIKSKHLTNLILKPSEAYYNFNCVNNYESAKKQIFESLESITYFKKMKLFEMVGAIAEQYQNFAKILIKEGKIIEGLKEYNNLILYLSNGINKSVYFDLGEKVDLNNFGKNDTFNTIDYIFHNAILKTIINKEINIDYFNILFKDLNSVKFYFQDDYMFLINKTIQVIINITENNSSEFTIKEILSKLYKLPNSLQFVFLKQISKIYQNDDEVENSIKEYATNKLNLGYLYLEQNNIDTYAIFKQNQKIFK